MDFAVNTFNRVIVVLDIVLTIVVVTLALAYPVQSLSGLIESGAALLGLIARIQPEYFALFKVLLGIVAILIDFLLIVLLVSEFRGPKRKTSRVASIEGGEVRVTLDSIANRLRYHIDPLPDILVVKPRVSRKRNGVAISMEIEASADVNVLRKAEEILAVTQQVIEDKLGLKLASKPEIQIRVMPYPPGAMPAVRTSLPTAPKAKADGPAAPPTGNEK